uniref:hypothetical protein n=1 Tax=Treponema sp. TaxID=166 RepID=UPI00298E6BF5
MVIAFVDMSFHIQNTKSSQFFIDMLKPLGTVHHISNIDAWRVVPKLKPDVVIIWQLLPTPDEIDFWGCKNVVMIPMYDACPHEIEFWNQYKKYKIFCFSKTLFDSLTAEGFNCFYSQYYIDPSLYRKPSFISKKVNAFFWERYQKLGWTLVSKVCQALPIKHIHYHTGLTQDSQSRPSDETIKKYSITFSEWFNDKSDMDKILDKTDIYIAPRVSEGIGLSFIEALARGNLVAAYDAPTM